VGQRFDAKLDSIVIHEQAGLVCSTARKIGVRHGQGAASRHLRAPYPIAEHAGDDATPSGTRPHLVAATAQEIRIDAMGRAAKSSIDGKTMVITLIYREMSMHIVR
jgi:hypothetical protein